MENKGRTQSKQTQIIKVATFAVCLFAMVFVPTMLIVANAGANPTMATLNVTFSAGEGSFSAGGQTVTMPVAAIDSFRFQVPNQSAWFAGSTLQPPSGGGTFMGWMFSLQPTRLYTGGQVFDGTVYQGSIQWGAQGTLQGTLTAIWNEPLNVTFHLQGAAFTHFAGNNQIVEQTSMTRLFAGSYGVRTTPVFHSSNAFTFDGWYTQPNGGVLFDTAQLNAPRTQNIELFARFNDAAIVTFSAGAGTLTPPGAFNLAFGIISGANNEILTRTLAIGSPIGIAPVVNNAGYDLVRWEASTNPGVPVVFTGGSALAVTGHKSIVAVWERNDFTVTFNTQGGTLNGSTTQTVLAGDTIARPQDPTNSNPDLYFRHWSTAPNGGVFNFNTAITTINSAGANNTLHAVWGTKHTVTLNLDGSGMTLALRVPTGFVINPNDFLPGLAGFAFIGWATTHNGPVVHAPGTTITVNTSITLFARWV
ncbi:MAG: InlB B-repeat-containing protein [Firmicutes bacterium]|nr:InlB B-repeat-containing protein [Bacillota bacterium]